ncbi:2-oxoglutarate (2OG) and Fe(II)-dependent oxygenase superfamily protein [Euphorbia peplus]|nr:2-oxoglutarate (2OG) and Fe(II)-dependent oxygenase superfamily protein [Euphorbia peplus]
MMQLPLIDLSAPALSTAHLIRQACAEYGCFYIVNHGVEEGLITRVFEQSKKFFLLPLDDKMKLLQKEHRGGFTPLCTENLTPYPGAIGESKESFHIGYPQETSLKQWPSEDIFI